MDDKLITFPGCTLPENEDELAAALRQIMKMRRVAYRSALEEGFDELQALELCKEPFIKFEA